MSLTKRDGIFDGKFKNLAKKVSVHVERKKGDIFLNFGKKYFGNERSGFIFFGLGSVIDFL